MNYYLSKPVNREVTITVYDDTRVINELRGPGKAGLNSVMWGMTKRGRKRTAEEIAQWDSDVANGRRDIFYDYYDNVDYYGSPDEEVGSTGSFTADGSRPATRHTGS